MLELFVNFCFNAPTGSNYEFSSAYMLAANKKLKLSTSSNYDFLSTYCK